MGVSGPGVVHHALKDVKGQPFDVVAETIKKTAFRVTRMGQLVAQEASRRLGVPFGIVDLSLALEEEFGIEELGEAEATSITTVGDLVRLIQSKID